MGNITLTAILGHKVYITTHCYKLLGYGICNLFYVSDMPIKYIFFLNATMNLADQTYVLKMIGKLQKYSLLYLHERRHFFSYSFVPP